MLLIFRSVILFDIFTHLTETISHLIKLFDQIREAYIELWIDRRIIKTPNKLKI